MRKKYALSAVALGAASILLLTGCVNNTGSGSASKPAALDSVSKDAKAAALLPASIRTSGKLIIGSDLSNPPSTYQTPNGAPTGWEIDLANDLAAKLGLKPEVQNAPFDNILPSVVGGKYALGMSGYFDTKAREKVADMIDYYHSGVQWATAKGKTVDPDDACGLKVAAQADTYESEVDLPAKSKACTDAGKPAIDVLAFQTEQDFTTAVTLGRANAMTADAPVVQYMVKQSHGKLQFAGKLYSPFVLGMVVSKSDPKLKAALVSALQSLIDDGTYKRVLEKWGIQAGAITKVTVNGAKS